MQENIRKAFNKALATMPDGLAQTATAIEGVPFNPDTEKPYQRTRLLALTPENPTFGGNYYRENGFFQVTLSYPNGKGMGNISRQADKVQKYFKRGTLLVEGDDKIIVDRTPDVSSPYVNDTRIELNIRIRYYCEQFNK